MSGTLTAANSVVMIGVANLFPVPQQLQGFSTDNIFSTEAVDSVQTQMGVDGILSGGWVAVEKPLSIELMANSDSNLLFDTWFATQEANRDAYPAFGTIVLPGLSRSATLVRGFLTKYKPLPDGKKLLGSRQFEIRFQQIIVAAI